MNLSTGAFLVMYGCKVEINTTPASTSATYVPIADGISNVGEALNEVKQQLFFLVNKGFGQTEITGMHPAVTFTGNRMQGDAAQDYIFSKKFKLGAERKTQIRVTVFDPDDPSTATSAYEADVTMTDIQELNGSAENGSDISFTLEFNGAPSPIS